MANRLSIKLGTINDDDLKEARESGGGFTRYEGPVPPADVYPLKLKVLMHSVIDNPNSTYHGYSRLAPLFEIAEGDYEGAPINGSFIIPSDSSDKNYLIQVSTLDRFLTSLSGGTITIKEFVELVNSGKVVVEETKGKVKRQKITQIGSLKIDKIPTLRGKTQVRPYNGEQRAELHYLEDAPKKPKGDDSLDDLSSDEGFDDFDDDLDI